MEVVTRELFQAVDGKIFEVKAECVAHEKELLADQARKDKLQVWTVNHHFDDTEGKGYFGKTHIITDQEMAVVLQYCLRKFGEPMSRWYSDSYYTRWILSKRIDFPWEKALQEKGAKPYYGHHPTEVVFLSDKPIKDERLPDPIMPEYK